MSIRWTQDQLLEYRARNQSPEKDPPPDPGKESRLLARIERYCVQEGFYVFHDRSRGKNKPGHPDIVLAMPGRCLWLELKSKHGRLSPEQKKIILQLKAMDQEVYEIRSYRQFLTIINRNP